MKNVTHPVQPRPHPRSDAQPQSQPQLNPGARSPLVVGIVLLLVGATLLAINLGYRIPYVVWEYWPLALIALGALAIALPSRHMGRSGGIWLVATGAYVEISLNDYMGLGWGSAWPIFLIAAGFDMILDRRKRDP